jgi:hypothetical protein
MKSPSERIDALLAAHSPESFRALCISYLGRIEAAASAQNTISRRSAANSFERRAALWAIGQVEAAAKTIGATDCHGTACPACRARLKDEIDRRHEIGKAVHHG